MGCREALAESLVHMLELLARRRQSMAAIVLLLIGIALAYGLLQSSDRTVPQASFTHWQSLTSFTENGVTADIALERDQAGQIWLAGAFTPTQARFHLYSKDLPGNGLNGLGRPTLLEIVSADGPTTVGPLMANQPTSEYYIEPLGQTFPVYPDGAVTLRRPIELPDSKGTVPTELSITYMACSAGVCLPPVIDKRVTVTISTTATR